MPIACIGDWCDALLCQCQTFGGMSDILLCACPPFGALFTSTACLAVMRVVELFDTLHANFRHRCKLSDMLSSDFYVSLHLSPRPRRIYNWCRLFFPRFPSFSLAVSRLEICKNICELKITYFPESLKIFKWKGGCFFYISVFCFCVHLFFRFQWNFLLVFSIENYEIKKWKPIGLKRRKTLSWWTKMVRNDWIK